MARLPRCLPFPLWSSPRFLSTWQKEKQTRNLISGELFFAPLCPQLSKSLKCYNCFNGLILFFSSCPACRLLSFARLGSPLSARLSSQLSAPPLFPALLCPPPFSPRRSLDYVRGFRALSFYPCLSPASLMSRLSAVLSSHLLSLLCFVFRPLLISSFFLSTPLGKPSLKGAQRNCLQPTTMTQLSWMSPLSFLQR